MMKAVPLLVAGVAFLRSASLIKATPAQAEPLFRCFESTEELYAAVDAVLWNAVINCDTVLGNGESSVTTSNKNASQLSSAVAAYQIYGSEMNAWCVGKLTNFSRTFSSARNSAISLHFRGDVFLWDVANATDMSYMFEGAAFFDGFQLGTWNTTSVRHMDGMFLETATAAIWEGDLSTWDVSNVITANSMFQGSQVLFNSTFNDIAQWKLSSLHSAVSMFDSNIRFRYDLCPWGSYLHKEANVMNMFRTTACFSEGQSTSDPNLTLATPGPFCYLCGDAQTTAAAASGSGSVQLVASGATALVSTTGNFALLVMITPLLCYGLLW